MGVVVGPVTGKRSPRASQGGVRWRGVGLRDLRLESPGCAMSPDEINPNLGIEPIATN